MAEKLGDINDAVFLDAEAIQNDFQKKVSDYEQVAQAITNNLLKAPGVHSARYRVKDPKRLEDKIIRKKLESPNRVLTVTTYQNEITDLAGVRVLHLFKGGWERIHKYITSTWELKEQPLAYYREGDSKSLLDRFANQGCELKLHPAAYRSVHYIIETSTTKSKKYVEIQVRTIFEEGWSEVDHRIRYPKNTSNPLVNDLLLMLNRLAGNADEMSTFVQELNYYVKESERDLKALERDKDKQIAELKEIIKNAKLSAGDKSKFENVANAMTDANSIANLRKFQNTLFNFGLTNSIRGIPSPADIKPDGPVVLGLEDISETGEPAKEE